MKRIALTENFLWVRVFFSFFHVDNKIKYFRPPFVRNLGFEKIKIKLES